MQSLPNQPAEDITASRPKEIVSQSEIEKLLAQVEQVDPGVLSFDPQALINAGGATVRRHDFPKLSLFSSGELRPLRVRHEDFIAALATRLSIHLGMEVSLQMSNLSALPFEQFANGLANPTYLTLVKLQPLVGVCLLDLPPRLCLSIVDRELGGPGRAAEEVRQIGKIEAKLITPVVTLILNEWCSTWTDLMEIRPNILGYETNSRYLNSSAKGTSMLVVGMQARVGETNEQMQIAFPHPMLEPLTVKMNAQSPSTEKPDIVSHKAVPTRLTPLLGSVPVEVKAEMPELNMSVEELSALKPGDVLKLPPEWMNHIKLRLPNHPGFIGTLGIAGHQRAIKISEALKN